MTKAEIEQVFHRLERGRTGERMRVALTVFARGESCAAAARSVGYADHRTLRRHAKRLGLDAVHRQARRVRELLQIVQEQQELAARPLRDPLAQYIAVNALGDRLKAFMEQD